MARYGSAFAGDSVHVNQLERRVDRGRRSRLPWRRQRAYEACLTLIELRERELARAASPTPIKPAAPTYIEGSQFPRPTMVWRR